MEKLFTVWKEQPIIKCPKCGSFIIVWNKGIQFRGRQLTRGKGLCTLCGFKAKVKDWK